MEGRIEMDEVEIKQARSHKHLRVTLQKDGRWNKHTADLPEKEAEWLTS